MLDSRVLYHRRGKADKYSEFLGPENRLFQGKKLAFCSGLTEWARWGQYLFKWQDVFWHLGYSSDEILCNDDLHILANFYIGEQPILRLLKKFASHRNCSRKKWASKRPRG